MENRASPTSPPASEEHVGALLGFHVVAIGASAGGLEALETLFEHMPARTGMAFVVLQHLSPDFESHMDELLGRKTTIPVNRVTNGMQVEPDAIYLIPPRKEMIISGGRLLLTEKDPDRGLTLPIDVFFRSLANDQGRFSVGVVLSGTGSDGSRGIRAIHEAGGLVLCQTGESAKFDGMPRAAVHTGVVDVVMTPREMPQALVSHARRRDDQAAELLGAEGSAPKLLDGMERIFELLRVSYGIDFAHYKPSTVTRRIERRLQMIAAVDLDDYAARLVASPAELDALYHDLLIGVTRFFRDQEAFEQIERHVIPGIVSAAGPRDEIRVWVAGCATGEEAYSIAILLHEQLVTAGRPLNVKMFATDVHRASLDIASQGLYDDASLADVSPARLERYFSKKNGKYQVAKELRQLIVFAPQHIVADAPFTRLDLVTCRNLLIYLQPSAQKKALSLFHFGMKTGGTLFLGPSESPGELADEFDPLDKHWKIYRKRRDIRLPHALRMPVVTGPRRRPLHAGWAALTEGSLVPIYDTLLGRYMPSGLLVDEHFNLLHCFGGAEKYTRIPSGRPSSSVVDLVPPELKTVVSGALQHAAKERKLVRYAGVPVRLEGVEQSYRIQVEPLPDDRAKTVHYLLTLETVGEPVSAPTELPVDLSQISRDRIESLEAELRFTKESLQASIEELETSNEELQATNEELVASNEELQSTNEELHSVNEELYTVNAELQSKIAELTETSADLDSVLQSSDVGVLFLDLDLRIRKFTVRISDVFRLMPQDVGRSIEAFHHRLDHPGFVDDLRGVLESGEPVEREIESEDRRSYFMRVLPYRQAGRLAGVVVTVLDIANLRTAERNSRLLSAIVASTADAIIAIRPDGIITQWNRGAERMYGYTTDEMIGRSLATIVGADRQAEHRALLLRAIEGQPLEYLETARRRKDGSVLHVSMQVSPILGASGEVTGIATIERDITQRKRAEDDVRQAVAQRERFLAILSHELRNPLAAVVSGARLLQKDDSTEELRHRALAVLQRQATHMARLLDDLLDISRIRQGKLELRNDALDLRQVVEASLETVGAQIDERGCEVVVAMGDAPIPMIGDPHRLRQLVVNLLTNAVRATQAGRRIEVGLERAGTDRAHLRVRDEGIGIPTEMLSRIFEPFSVAGTPGRRSGGLGIGLWLVRSIAEAHGGVVKVTSGGIGHGTEFVVELPISAAAVAPPRPSTVRQVQSRVVLVEDQTDLQELLEAILVGAGMKVRTAETAEAALELFEQEVPEVAVVDIGLPGMSGLDFAKALRARLGSDRLRLIALTGFGQQADRQAVYDAGFDQHLVKPVDLDVLIDVIRSETLRLHGETVSDTG
jgi:two-component system, chemotaxis family, CheB/CheR fusion protein